MLGECSDVSLHFFDIGDYLVRHFGDYAVDVLLAEVEFLRRPVIERLRVLPDGGVSAFGDVGDDLRHGAADLGVTAAWIGSVGGLDV